jgi:tripartite-type tricarboxylate transporter receptor subunit TctC
MFPTAASVTPHVKTGRLKALAITSADASILAPGLPPVALTLPGYESVSTHGFFAPAKTPANIVKQLNQEILLVLNRADIKDVLFANGLEVVGSSPERFAATMQSEMLRLRAVIKEAGIRAD